MKVSIIKIIKSDYSVVLLLVAPLMVLAIYIDTAYFGILRYFFSSGQESVFNHPIVFLKMTILVTVISSPLLFFRIKIISDCFKNGLEINGRIVYLKLWKDRGRVEYEYLIGGEMYRVGNAVHRSKFVNSLVEGQVVLIVVSKENPKRAFIKKMYQD